MVYNSNWFYFLVVFILIILVSFLFLRKYKYVNLIFPYKWNFSVVSFFQYLLIFLIFIIISLIPFNIWIYQWTKIKKEAKLNIQVLFDVSLSMTAKDFNPDRFTVAKQSLVEFVKWLDTHYNISLIAFSGKPFIYFPFTDDKKAIIWKISHMWFKDFPPTLDFVWTAIGDAILLWVKNLIKFSNKKDHPGVILLFTDGDSNKGIDPLLAVKQANKYNIPIYVWAIWKAKTYIVWKDKFGNEVPTSMDTKVLEEIAKQTWWEFKKITSKEDFLEILSKIYSYVKNYEEVKKINEYFYLNYYLKLFLVFLLLIYFILFVIFKI